MADNDYQPSQDQVGQAVYALQTYGGPFGAHLAQQLREKYPAGQQPTGPGAVDPGPGGVQQPPPEQPVGDQQGGEQQSTQGNEQGA